MGVEDRTTEGDKLILYKIDELSKDVQTLSNKVDNKYVTLERFQTVERLVYGQAALMLVGAAGAILKLVIK